MDKSNIKTFIKKDKRQMRVRKKLRGTSLRPRLTVHRSNQHISVQVIDDEAGKTLCAFSTRSKGFVLPKEVTAKSKEAARIIGEKIAEIAVAKDIQKVVFDRGPYKYHGVVAFLAEAARSKGLQF